MPIQPIYHENGPNGLNQHCCLAGSSKTAPRILIFSIVLGAEYLFYLESIATYAPAFLGYNISALARVKSIPDSTVQVSAKAMCLWKIPGILIDTNQAMLYIRKEQVA